MRHVIICTGLDGYRRAGLVLTPGLNRVEAELDAAQLDELRADHRTVLVERDILPPELVREIGAEALSADLVAAIKAEARAEAEAEAKAKIEALVAQVATAQANVRLLGTHLAEAEARAAATPPAAAEAPPADKPTARKKAG